MICVQVSAMYRSKLKIDYLCLLVELLPSESAISWANLFSPGLGTTIRVGTLHPKLEATFESKCIVFLEGICYNLVFHSFWKACQPQFYFWHHPRIIEILWNIHEIDIYTICVTLDQGIRKLGLALPLRPLLSKSVYCKVWPFFFY